MGKKGSGKKPPNFPSEWQSSMTLREEASGKRQKTSVNPKSMLKLDHIKNLALWASREASIPSLGAFFGHRLAALSEALGAPPDPSLFPCQRCESILEPGHNCTIRIEKNKSKARCRRKRPDTPTQNNVVYKCHFCSHRNLKRGTPRGHMKEVCPPKTKPSMKSKSSRSIVLKSVNSEEAVRSNPEFQRTDEIVSPAVATDEIVSPAVATDDPVTDSPTTPLVKTSTLLEAKKRKRNRSGSKKVAESESSPATLDVEKTVSTSNRRKKKPWTSLKEIAENSERSNNQNLKNLSIPFLI